MPKEIDPWSDAENTVYHNRGYLVVTRGES